MKIYKLKARFYQDAYHYYFIKNENECLVILHNLNEDYGEHSSSGAMLEVEIHYQNSFEFDKPDESQITIDQVPKRVIDVLTYLNPIKP